MLKATLKTHRRPGDCYYGFELVKAREALKLTQEEFAALCGWSQQNQQQLELPEIEHHLDFHKKELFARIGVIIISK